MEMIYRYIINGVGNLYSYNEEDLSEEEEDIAFGIDPDGDGGYLLLYNGTTKRYSTFSEAFEAGLDNYNEEEDIGGEEDIE